MRQEKTTKLNLTYSGLYNLEIRGQHDEILLQKKDIEFKKAIEELEKYSLKEHSKEGQG